MNHHDWTVEVANKVIEAMEKVKVCQRAAESAWRETVKSGDYAGYTGTESDKARAAIFAAKIAINEFIKVTDIGESYFNNDCE